MFRKNLFQLTASQGGWLSDLRRAALRVIFQLTASQGGWRPCISGLIWASEFQLTASQGGWQKYIHEKGTQVKFQLTASQGGWHQKGGWEHGKKKFQLTASQGGWRKTRVSFWLITHFNSQPHKEADCTEVITMTREQAFQLTASQGGWRSGAASRPPATVHFNSQPHKEADPITYKTRASHYISTHSLTRRLTLLCFAGSRTLMYFNSQPHKEADRDLTKTKEKFETFQLTASQGGWRWFVRQSNDCEYISTHSLTRRLTPITHKTHVSHYISTHSLTRRLTVSYWKCFHGCSISTHSLTRRLTKCCSSVITFSRYFNSQPHKEADGKQHQKEHCQRIFQLTASQGGWPIRYRNLLLTQDFNSQPHKEADGNRKTASKLLDISTHSLTRRLTTYLETIFKRRLFQLTASQGGWRRWYKV